jgi:eukaryotic-like serine/threonine-protein kinase
VGERKGAIMRLLADNTDRHIDGGWDSAARRHRTNTTTVRGECQPPPDGPALPFRPGPLPPRYEYLGPIGAGGMGSVCSVHDLYLLRCVAMKFLGRDASRTPDHVRRFVREAQITAELEHPNVIPVYDWGTDDDGNHFFTMKRVDGRTLAEWIDSMDLPARKPEVLRDMLSALSKICDGLAFAHSRGVLHCDIKPENIMVGSRGQAYLMDWGVARVRNETAVAGWLPSEIPAANDPSPAIFRGSLNGTPSFMAPEQAFGYMHLVDERTDVFGLGTVLYTILTGRPPFQGCDIGAVLLEARVCSVSFSCAGRDGLLQTRLREVALRAMARAPGDRFQSVVELQCALQDAIDAAG